MYDTDLRYLEGSNVLKDCMHALSGRVQEASNGYGRTMLTFINIRTPHDEGHRLFQAGVHFSLDGAPEPGLRFDPMPTLAPLTGGWSNAAALIGVADPIAGQHVNEHSVMLRRCSG